jgi:hypothetical protein
LEAWEKVYVSDAAFAESVHGKLTCIGCHHGNNGAEDKDAAHVSMVPDPSEETCSICHDGIAETDATGLHATVGGMRTALVDRGGSMADGSVLATAFDNHCAGCHTTCGQCHVSRPTTLGGGLLAGHTFKAVPSMTNNCSGCHGARIAAEYFGQNEGVPGDVHWTKNGMTCYDCHQEDELHGEGQTAAGRYHQTDAPSCTECHADIADANTQHSLHIGKLACQVCHSVDYKSCYNCHVDLDANGTPYFTTDASEMTFMIGHNPNPSGDIPWEYVVVRHVPVTPETFSSYGDDLLPDFNDVPTWKYATPHNIQLDTPQNASCANCHGNEDIFLSTADVSPAEMSANEDVIAEPPALFN